MIPAQMKLRPRLERGPATAISASSRRGWAEPGPVDHHGFGPAKARDNEKEEAERIDVFQRVQGIASHTPGRVIAEVEGNKGMGELMHGESENNARKDLEDIAEVECWSWRGLLSASSMIGRCVV